jgi:CRISPR-associated endonuclease/helicase Cas3
LEKSILIAALYHDLGKLDEQAQKVLYGESTDKMLNHVDAGVAFCLKVYLETKKLEFLLAAYLIHSHHIGMVDFNTLFDIKANMLKIYICPKEAFRDGKSCSVYGLEDLPVYKRTNEFLQSYLEIHNQEIGEHKEIFDVVVPQEEVQKVLNSPFSLKVAISVLCDADHEDTSRHYKEPYPNSHANSLYPEKRLEKIINYSTSLFSDSARNRLRRDFFHECLSNVSSHAYELMDGTVGIGKTIGLMARMLSVAIRNGCSGIVIALPYIALIEQSVETFVKAIALDENDAKWNINAIHSIVKTRNVYHRKYMRGFNAPINVTTSVGLFQMICSNHTSVFKNVHKLVGKVIGIDEYHAIAEAQYWPILLSIIKEMGDDFGCKFIFSSGTPSRYWEIDAINRCMLNGKDLPMQKIISDDLYEKMLEVESNRVKTIAIQQDTNFNKILKKMKRLDGSIFLIFTTKDKARLFYEYSLGRTSKEVFLRYSSLCPRDRKAQMERIKTAMLEHREIILVATQGSDVGLDLSFNHGFKESSDYNSLLQMLGRVNRNCEFSNSKVYVFTLEDEFMGKKFAKNPSLMKKAKILEEDQSLVRNPSPAQCTAVTEMEIEGMSRGNILEMEELVRCWENRKFSTLEENFHIINMPSISILINEEIYFKMTTNAYVDWNEIQDCIVNMTLNRDKIDEFLDSGKLIPLEKKVDENNQVSYNVLNNNFLVEGEQSMFGVMYFWNGEYDSENLGIAEGWSKPSKTYAIVV